MDNGGEAVVQFGHVRAAFVLVMVLAELDANFAGRGRVDSGCGEGGGADVVGVVGLAAAAVSPPAERQFWDSCVVFQDQLSVISCDASLLFPLILGAVAALSFVHVEGLTAISNAVIVPVSVAEARQSISTI